MTRPDDVTTDDEVTAKTPIETMRELVFGTVQESDPGFAASGPDRPTRDLHARGGSESDTVTTPTEQEK